MALYPDVPTRSQIQAQNIKIEASDGGVLRGQDLAGFRIYDIELTHDLLTWKQVRDLQQFHAANRNTRITTQPLADRNNYDCLLLHEPDPEDDKEGLNKTVKQKLVGRRVYSLLSVRHNGASAEFDFSAQGTNAQGVGWSDDGRKMFILQTTAATLDEYDVPAGSEFKPKAAVYSQSLDLSLQDTAPTAFTFFDSGKTLLVVGDTNDTIFQYTFTTGYDTSTASYASKSYDFGTNIGETAGRGIAIDADDDKVFLAGQSNQAIFAIDLGTAGDVGTGQYNNESFSTTSFDTQPSDLTINPTDTKLFVSGTENQAIYEINLAIDDPGNLNNASADLTFTVSDHETAPLGLTFADQGTFLHIVGTQQDAVIPFTLGI